MLGSAKRCAENLCLGEELQLSLRYSLTLKSAS